MALTERELEALARAEEPSVPAVAVWDLAACPATAEIVDASPNGNHGVTVGMPMRGVTGHDWSGRETSFPTARSGYGAIHFHDDDLEDAGWDVDFELSVPEDLPSGVYAARLTSEEGDDRIPFFVRPSPGSRTAPIAFLAPTFSYLAYANEQQSWRNPQVLAMIGGVDGVDGVLRYVSAEDHYAVDSKLLSLYDQHSDGTGVCYSSRLRPVVNIRPGYIFAVARAPHQFSADLELVTWLHERKDSSTICTDEDLHHEGTPLLEDYRVCHGDTPGVLERADAGRGRGIPVGRRPADVPGRQRVLLGHVVDPSRPHVVEVRRGQAGTRTCESAPGERAPLIDRCEPGGLWRYRGRAPQRLAGVGFSAQGLGPAQPYRRLPASRRRARRIRLRRHHRRRSARCLGQRPRRGSRLEIHRLDFALGTPLEAFLLATASDFSDAYQAPVEEILMSDSRQGGSVNDLVRADLVYLEYPSGGAVFSTGSIAWCGSARVDEAVARTTANVLDHFVSDGPCLGPAQPAERHRADPG